MKKEQEVRNYEEMFNFHPDSYRDSIKKVPIFRGLFYTLLMKTKLS